MDAGDGGHEHGLYRRFYRQKWKAFAGAGDGPNLTGSDFSLSIINRYRQPKSMPPPNGQRVEACRRFDMYARLDLRKRRASHLGWNRQIAALHQELVYLCRHAHQDPEDLARILPKLLERQVLAKFGKALLAMR